MTDQPEKTPRPRRGRKPPTGQTTIEEFLGLDDPSPPAPPAPPRVLIPPQPPRRKRLHQHSPEIVALPTPGPWKRISDLKDVGALIVVANIYWRPTEREIDVYEITDHGLWMFGEWERGRPVTFRLRRLARDTDPISSIVSGYVTFDQIKRPNGLLHKVLRAFA